MTHPKSVHLPQVSCVDGTKDWHLTFRGHPDDLLDLEEQIYIHASTSNPVVLTNHQEDVLDVWLEWNPVINGNLLGIVNYENIRIDVNERPASTDEAALYKKPVVRD